MADLPLGAGLSSSAAIEVVTAFALTDILGLKMTKEEIALLCLKVENDFVGMGCGVMDQMASAICEQDHCLLLNCLDLSVSNIPLTLGDYEIVITHTGKPRSLDGSAFNHRREECSLALSQLQKYYTINELCQLKSDKAVFNLIKDEDARKRAIHVIKENERVLKAAKSLRKNNIYKLGKLMNKSHDSLRDYYEVTGIELDTIVEVARNIEGVLAARMSGGGFGGCSINLVRKDRLIDFKKELAVIYKEKTGLDVSFYSGESGGGVRKID
jgi:galactokinase